MDKEKLIKHHFWILLVLVLLLLPVTLGAVWMSVADATAKQSEVVEGKKKTVSTAKSKAIGKNVLEEQDKQKSLLDGSKDGVWKEVYDAQRGLLEWPAQLSHLDSLHFGDPITDVDRNTFRKFDVYENEFEGLERFVRPTDVTKSVMKIVKWGERPPTSEDCWLAMEDLCIQREMLRCVHSVNELLARFLDKTKDAEKELKELFNPVGDESVHRFVSPYWQLDLAISKSSQAKGTEFVIRGQLKNLSHRRMNIGQIVFKLALNDPASGSGRTVDLPVGGEYLPVNQTLSFADKRVTINAPKPFIYSVEQKLDVRFVPVKKIERIALSYHSHRTADKALVPCAMSEEEKKRTTAEPPPTDTANTATPGAAAAPTGEKSASGIDRNRYLTVTQQVRRMPIGVLLLVDQAHVQDVLRAFANSRLRWQTVQVHVSRARSGMTSSGSAGPNPVAPLPGIRGGIPGAVVPQPAMVTQPSEEVNANLVEMAIYGLASIYEKFPPKAPPADGANSQPKTN